MTAEAHQHEEAGSSPTCPRCGTSLVPDVMDGYLRCLVCGHYDYDSPVRLRPLSEFSKHIVLRYGGPEPALQNRLVKARILKPAGREDHNTPQDAALAIDCPWCDLPMSESSLSGKRREPSEVRYACPMGHRISVLPKPVALIRFWWLPPRAQALEESRRKAPLVWR